MPQTLRADQLDLVERTRQAFRRVRRVCVQAACGWGKTTFAAEVIRRASERGTRTLVFAHRRRLIRQISDRLHDFGVRHGVLMADLPDDLWARSDRSAPVLVVSKDTLLSRAPRDGMPPADLVVIDEAHRCLSPGMTDLLNHYKSAFRLGLTATPCGGDGRGLSGYFDELVCAPSVSQLIAAGTVVPYRVYAALEMREARAGRGVVRPAGDPVSQWCRFSGGRPTVLFAPNVATSRMVVESFRRAGIPAVHIDSHSSEEEREDAADGLESGRYRVVSNCNLWSEGTDVPCVAVVQLLTRCGSLVKYIQATQRAGRSYPGKSYAVVIDHCGAIFEHGFPDDDVEWSLSPGEPVRKSHRRNQPAREPIICVRCGLCYTGTVVCPGCGTAVPTGHKTYQPEVHAHLVEVKRDQKKLLEIECHQRLWTQLLYQFARSGRTIRAVASAFRARTGEWPNRADVEPLYDFDQLDDLVIDVFPQYGRRARCQ